MKRKITKLEQKLLENGYELVIKGYCGKHSEKIAYYMYQNGWKLICLNQKREKVVDFGIQNVSFTFFGNKQLEQITNDLRDLNVFVATLLADQPLTQVLKDYDIYLESDVDHQLKKRYGKTFEELDIENQEIESGEK